MQIVRRFIMHFIAAFSLGVVILGASVAYGRPKGPPPEAIEACQNAEQGDACSFEGRDGVLQGTCFSPREDLPLACRPDNARPPRSSGR